MYVTYITETKKGKLSFKKIGWFCIHCKRFELIVIGVDKMIESLSESNRKEIEALKKRIEEIEALHRLQDKAARKAVEEYKRLNL